jgi:hypothetical protein
VPTWALAAAVVVLGFGGVALVLWGVLGGSSSTPSGLPVDGVVAITNPSAVIPDLPVPQGTVFGTDPNYNVGRPCHAAAGYQDIVSGARVVITNGSGKQLAKTTLKRGVFDTQAGCVFGFTTHVPKSSAYQIKIGQRDPVNYPPAAIGHPQLGLG